MYTVALMFGDHLVVAVSISLFTWVATKENTLLHYKGKESYNTGISVQVNKLTNKIS
jgi:hypothetical protein